MPSSERILGIPAQRVRTAPVEDWVPPTRSHLDAVPAPRPDPAGILDEALKVLARSRPPASTRRSLHADAGPETRRGKAQASAATGVEPPRPVARRCAQQAASPSTPP